MKPGYEKDASRFTALAAEPGSASPGGMRKRFGWIENAALAGGIAAWLLMQTWRGLFAAFTPDDIMNMYWAWTEPLGRLMVANFIPFASSSYRPLGAVIYRASFGVFGLQPFPLRVVIYALLVVNAWLVFRLASRLTGSREIAALAAFLMSYHPRLGDIYTNTGTIFDVLCCTFYALTLLYYADCRTRGRLAGWNYAVLYLLITATLNSKEIGASLPVVLLAFEWIYFRPVAKWRALARWAARDLAAIWISAALTAFSIARKIGADSHFHGIPDYKLRLSLAQYFETTGKFLRELFCVAHPLPPAAVIGVFGVLIAIALIARRKYIWFCVAFILAGPLPVNFIVSRSLFAIYVVLMAWSILAAGLLVEARDWLYARVWKRPPLPPDTWEPERVFLFLAVALTLGNVSAHNARIDWNGSLASKSLIHASIGGLRGMHLKPAKNDRILLVDDRFTKDDWIPVLLLRMIFRNPELSVDRAKWMNQIPNAGDYKYVVDWARDRVVQAQSPNS